MLSFQVNTNPDANTTIPVNNSMSEFTHRKRTISHTHDLKLDLPDDTRAMQVVDGLRVNHQEKKLFLDLCEHSRGL